MSIPKRLMPVLAAVMVLAACDVDGPYHVPMTKEPFMRWEAPGEVGVGYGRQNIHWIDDDRVLYVGRDEGEGSDRTSLRVWSLATGAVKVIGPAVGEICYFRGHLTYWESIDNETWLIRRGTLESTIPEAVHAPTYVKELREQGYRWDPMNCRNRRLRDLAPNENCKVPLLPGHGYLETQGGRCEPATRERIDALRGPPYSEERRREAVRLDRQIEMNSVRYVPHGSERSIALPIQAHEIATFGDDFLFVEWKQQYLLRQQRPKIDESSPGDNVWPEDQSYVVYLLSPTGDLEQLSVPFKRWFHFAPRSVMVTRAGAIGGSPGETKDKRRAEPGLLLFRGETVVQLDDGLADQPAVSPDGCKVAYERRTLTHDKAHPVQLLLRVIDLCRVSN